MTLTILSFLPLSAQTLVEGVVVESVGKTPVAGALVQVIWTRPLTGTSLLHGLNDQGPKTETGETGRFRVEVPDSAEFTFKVSRTGFTPLEGTAAGRFTLKGKESRRDIVLVIQAECSIEGRVYDSVTEAPVVRLPIQAFGQFSPRPGRSIFAPGKRSVTSADGRYRIEGLRPGKYRVIAGPSSPISFHEVRESVGRPSVYPQVFFPGAEDERGAVDLDLLPGASIGAIDFRVQKKNLFRVRTKVVRADGQPVTGSMRFSFLADVPPTLTSLRGYGQIKDPVAFEIEPVSEGMYLLSGIGDSENRKDRLWGSVPVAVSDKDVEGVLLTLRSGVTVTGTVQTEGATPGRLDSLWSALEADVTVDVIRESGNRWADERPVPVDRDGGKWKIDGVHFEPLRVTLKGLPPGYVVTAMDYNGVAAQIGRIDLNPYAISHHLKIDVAGVTNSIRGTVANGKGPVHNAVVAVVRESVAADTKSRLQKWTLTGAGGEYAFDVLEPGRYRIAAVSPEENDGTVHGLLSSNDCKRVEVTKTTNVTVNLEIK